MQDKTFDKGICILQASYPNLNMTPDALGVWRQLLDDMKDDDFEKSIITVCREVREIYPGTNIVALIREQTKPKINMALLAWTTAMQAVNKYGYDKTVSFEDKVINSVIKHGWEDWDKFCVDFRDREPEWIQKEFERLYEMCQNFKSHPAKVLGYHDLHNIGQGHKEQEVLKISSCTQEEIKMIGGENGR